MKYVSFFILKKYLYQITNKYFLLVLQDMVGNELYGGRSADSIAGFDELQDVAEGDMDPDDPLFRSATRVGPALYMGFLNSGIHNSDFGKMFMFISHLGSRILISYALISQFMIFFSWSKDEQIGHMYAGVVNIGDITLTLIKGNYGILFARNDIYFTPENMSSIVLSFTNLGKIREIMPVFYSRIHTFEMNTLVLKEAITDIKAELRMLAHGSCDGCREMFGNVHPHTCTSIIGDRLDRRLADALISADKWPFSRAIVTIYERLDAHKTYFKHNFRHSMAWNKAINQTYKLQPLPAHMLDF
jgi:hypothetical protein